ncbi:uroporphyrinogen decarboxylase [Eubacterium sp. AM05-23]|uniref:uroporphyrinogen decarboxylase family protein n=1 Tax=Eubacterium TaxID=1730 RepID=UPI000E5293FA|nr:MULTISPECIES: uroporphyrinogen decarboxylase family protein [Eubacterium]RHO61114.1 uroporphyrinogen decarboxylase [Eubacterium sp. AM05-23]
MSTTKQIFEERQSIYEDVLNGKTPKRVPIDVACISSDFAIEYAGMNLLKAQYDMNMIAEAFEILCKNFNKGDLFPSYHSRLAGGYQILDSQSFIMGSSGVIQHPEVVGMSVDDYDYLIEKPYDCLVEKIIPNHYKSLRGNKMQSALALGKYVSYSNECMGIIYGKIAELTESYGFFEHSPGGYAATPLDFLADQLRSFKGISMDFRRFPEKVEAACEALLPLLIKMGLAGGVGKFGRIELDLHMGPYMKPKDFERFYWPTFKKQVDAYAQAGQRSLLFVENNWTPHFDKLQDLPAGTVLRFEFGDPKTIKEKFGNKFIISGLYPISLLKMGTKQQCIDKAKELLDILAPGGNYFFNFDKEIITLDSINIENYNAVIDYVLENGKY